MSARGPRQADQKPFDAGATPRPGAGPTGIRIGDRLWITGDRENLPLLGFVVGIAISILIWTWIGLLVWFLPPLIHGIGRYP